MQVNLNNEGSIFVKTFDDAIVLCYDIPKGACYIGGLFELNNDEALTLAFYILRRHVEINSVQLDKPVL